MRVSLPESTTRDAMKVAAMSATVAEPQWCPRGRRPLWYIRHAPKCEGPSYSSPSGEPSSSWTERFRWAWDLAFAGGSVVAAFCQCLILGGLIGGVSMQGGVYAGGTFGFFSFLGLICGAGLTGGYAYSAPAASSGRPTAPPKSSPERSPARPSS